MSIAVTTEHHELSASLRGWARDLDGPGAIRDAERDEGAGFDRIWRSVTEFGATSIGQPQSVGGGGGTLLEQAIALEACAYAMLPGPLLGSAVTGVLAAEAPDGEQIAAAVAGGARCAVVLGADATVQGDRVRGSGTAVLGAPEAQWLLAELGDRWYAVPAGAASIRSAPAIDLGARAARVEFDAAYGGAVPLGTDPARGRTLMVALAAAEASGIARWCLDTAVDYAKTREQFGRPIGAFQAVGQLCATMLERAESISALAWDAVQAVGAPPEADAQARFAADVAGAVAFDDAVSVAQDCIQVLGGIGFTFEHDAHLYLRRALALRAVAAALTGGADRCAQRLAERAGKGERRQISVDLEGRDADLRTELRREIADIAALSGARRHRALADSGLLAVHLPPPAGRNAGPVEQLVVEQELAAANVERPDLAIGGWAIPTIIAAGTQAQRERFVAPTLRGELSWCQLFSEPEAGSDLASLRTRAQRTDGGWLLSGQKVWTSLAHQADWGIALARTDPQAPQHRGISYFLVDMRSRGIEIRPLRELTGEALFNEVFLDDVFVPDDCLVGEPGRGWSLARTTLANERVAMAAIRLGQSTERAVALLAPQLGPDHVRVGNQVALATVCQVLGVRTVLRSLAGAGPGPESSVAKLLGVRNRQEAADLVVRLQGAAGVVLDDEHVAADAHAMLMTRCLSIAGGTTQVLRNVVAQRILGLPRD